MPNKENIDRVLIALPGYINDLADRLDLSRSTIWRCLNTLIVRQKAHVDKYIRIGVRGTFAAFYDVGPRIDVASCPQKLTPPERSKRWRLKKKLTKTI